MRVYCGARVFSTLASSLLGATLGWHVYDLTLSTLALGTLGLVQFVPTPITLLGGALADNRDRRSIVATAQGAACVAALGLALVTSSGAATLPLLLATAFALAVGRSFESPANTREICDGMVLGGEAEQILDLLHGPRHAQVRVFSGYSGWEAGQLRSELESGSWITCPASARFVFEVEPNEAWEAILRSLGPRYAYLTTIPLDPRVN